MDATHVDLAIMTIPVIAREASEDPTVAADPDAALFDALRRGRHDALDALIARHDPWVRGLVLSTLGKRDGVDDVAQQVWLNVWRQVTSLDDVAKWRPWLYRLARNAAIDHGRRSTLARRVWKGFTQVFAHPDAHHAEPGENLARREQHQRVLSAVYGLPDIYREPFVLRHLSDFSYGQIAQALGIPEGTVETRLTRARRLLREALGHEHAPAARV